MRDYPRLDLISFGRHLFATGDLDPVYLALQRADYGRDQLARWLVAYWCFYSAGFASYASERTCKGYWELMIEAARNVSPAPIGTRWPRGAERRHFRGVLAERTIGHLQSRHTFPEDMLFFLLEKGVEVRTIVERAQTYHGFGPWIAFKIVDMIDAVWIIGGVHKNESLCFFLYDNPRAAIDYACERGELRVKRGHDRYAYAMLWLREQLCHCRIPHKPYCTPDAFALETVWCKYLSHANGHYPLNKDTLELLQSVAPWAQISEAARQFERGVPEWRCEAAGQRDFFACV